MELSQKDFLVLEALDSYEIETQRQLAEHAGISLGQVNYVLKSLLDKGLVKIGRFKRNPNKIRYMYLLTPRGIEAKSKLAVSFVLNRLKKYHSLRKKLAKKLTNLEDKGFRKIFFVGPRVVYDLILSVHSEMDMDLEIVNNLHDWRDLKNYGPESFDVAIILDNKVESFKEIRSYTKIPRKKLRISHFLFDKWENPSL